MKAIVRVVLFFTVLNIVFSRCDQKPKIVTKVAGRIENADSETMVLTIRGFDRERLTEDDIKTIEVDVDSEGNFAVEINDLEEDVFYAGVKVNIGHGAEWTKIHLSPRDSIYMTLDAEKFDESLSYSGRGAAKNNYYVNKFLIFEDRKEGIGFGSLFSLPFKEYIDTVRARVGVKKELLDSMYKGQEKDTFYAFETSYIEVEKVYGILMYLKASNFRDIEEAKTYLGEIGLQEQTQFNSSWHRRAIVEYVEAMTYGMTDMEQYGAAKKMLSGDLFRFYCKNGVVKMVTSNAYEDILAALQNDGVEPKILAHLQGKLEDNNKLKKQYPNKRGNYVPYNTDLKKSTFNLSVEIKDQDINKAELYDKGILGSEKIIKKKGSSSILEFDIPIYYSHDVNVRIGRLYYTIIANPGDNLYAVYENGKARFYGDGAEQAELINEFTRTVHSHEHPFRDKEFVFRSPLEVKNAFVNRYNEQIVSIKEFFEDVDEPVLENWARSQAAISNFGSLVQLENIRSHYNKKEKRKLEPIPSDFYGFKEEYLSLDMESFVCSEFVSRLSYYGFKDYYSQVKNTNDKINRILDLAKAKMKPLEYDISFSTMINSRLRKKEFDFIDKVMPRYQDEVTTGWLKEAMVEKYEVGKKTMLSLEIPEGTDLNQIPKTSGDSLLSKIINKHKGKVIYIDMWATWCSPCIGEFEFAKDFHDGIDHDKVALVYLAGKSKESVWKSMIKEYQLKGDHYLLTDDQHDDISQKLEARGFPNYSIIDSKGMVKAANAPRPSVGQQDLNKDLINTLNAM